MYRRNYYALPPVTDSIDLTKLEDRQLASFLSAHNLDALRFLVLQVIQDGENKSEGADFGDQFIQTINSSRNVVRPNNDDSIYELDHTVRLVKEDFEGFNIVHWRKKWYGFDRATGPINLEDVSNKILKNLCRNNTCVIANSMASLEAKIVKLINSRSRL